MQSSEKFILSDFIATNEKFLRDQLPGFCTSELWRLSIDGKNQNDGPYVLDDKGILEPGFNNPGYLEGVMRAFVAANKLDKKHKLTSETIVKIHAIAIAPQERAKEDKYGKLDVFTELSPFHTSKVTFKMILEGTQAFASKEGIKEILSSHSYKEGWYKLTKRDPKLKSELILDESNFEQLNPNDEVIYTSMINHSSDGELDNCKKNFHKKIQSELNKFYHKTNELDPNSDIWMYKLIELICTLERDHYFYDGNGRTNYLLLNLLLIQNNLVPTILHDPNHIDGFSALQILNEIKKGQQEYKKFSYTRLQDEAKLSIDTGDRENISNKIKKSLSSDPEIALAQIHSTYLYVKEDHNKKFISYLCSFFQMRTSIHSLWEKSLEDVFEEKYTEFISTHPTDGMLRHIDSLKQCFLKPQLMTEDEKIIEAMELLP